MRKFKCIVSYDLEYDLRISKDKTERIKIHYEDTYISSYKTVDQVTHIIYNMYKNKFLNFKINNFEVKHWIK